MAVRSRSPVQIQSDAIRLLGEEIALLRRRLQASEANNIALRHQMQGLESVNARLRIERANIPQREPEPDLSPVYKTGDMIRPNGNRGSVTLLRDTGTILRFRPIITWSQHEVPHRVQRLLLDDNKNVVSRLRESI